MNKDELSKEEKEKARQNGFVLAGKTGAGKTTLLNAIFGKEVGKVERRLTSVTKNSKVYYYKLENGECICLIDTPGLSDCSKLDNKNIDNINLEGITKVISEQGIHIKGILFLVNFQNERFDADEQEALLNYNKVFPLKRFWKNLIVIFTHHFADPDGDDEEEMKRNRDKSNSEIFSKIMDKVKNVSNVIDYKELKIKYFNSYCPVKNEKQKNKNIKVRDELEVLLDNLINSEPLFNQIEILHIKNQICIDEKTGKKYKQDLEIIGYFDLNKLPIKETIKVLTREEITDDKEDLPAPEIKVDVYKAEKNDNGLNHVKQEGNENNSKYIKNYSKTKAGFVIGTLGGIIIGGATAGLSMPAVGIGAAVVATSTIIGYLFN